jgi:hypothetical protein
MEKIAGRPDIKSVLLISTGINDIDATGLQAGSAFTCLT